MLNSIIPCCTGRICTKCELEGYSKWGFFLWGYTSIVTARQNMGIGDKNGLMVNSKKSWFPFRATCQSAHSTSPRAAARQHITPLQDVRCLPASQRGPSLLHTTEAEGVLQGTLHPSSCHPGECDEQAMLFHIPWPVFCQETWAEVQGISLTLENVEQCQILWQIKPWMSQSGIHRQWKYLMLYSVPWFTLTQEMQECISLTRKYFPPNVSDPCKNKWNSNSHKLKQPLQK